MYNTSYILLLQSQGKLHIVVEFLCIINQVYIVFLCIFSSCPLCFPFSLIFINLPEPSNSLTLTYPQNNTVNAIKTFFFRTPVISLACYAKWQIRREPWHCSLTCIQTLSWNVNIICLHCTAPINRLLYCNVHSSISAAVAISIQPTVCSFL